MYGGNNIFLKTEGQDCPQEITAKIADIVNAPVIITKKGGASLYDQKVVYANNAFCEATGYAESEIIGRSPEFLYSQKNGGTAALEFFKNCHAGQPFRQIFDSFKKDATEQQLTAEVTPIYGSEQMGVNYIIYFSEIKPTQELQEQPPAETIQTVVENKAEQPQAKNVFVQEEDDIEIPVAPVIEEEATRNITILEEIQAELRGESAIEAKKAEAKEPEQPAQPSQEEEDDDPFGLEDFIGDDDDDLKEEYKLNDEPQEQEAPIAGKKDVDFEFFSKLGAVLEPQAPEPITKVEEAREETVETAQEEPSEQEASETVYIEDPVARAIEEVSAAENEGMIPAPVAEAEDFPEEEPYQNSQIAELIRKLEQKKEEAKHEESIKQVKEESEHPEVVEQDLDYYAKARFLSNMSHDLRTPLNAIIGFSEVIRDQLFGPIDNQRYISYANDIYKSGQELLGTVSEILELSEIEHEESPLEEEDFSLTNTIDEVLDLLSSRAFQTDVKLMKKLRAENISCNGDRKKLKQAFAGVINNAIKSSPSGGTLEISSEINGDGNFQMMVYIKSANMIAAKSNLGSLLGTVTNKIESEYPEILLAHKFIEAHGGDFSIFNSATSGTEISIILPAERLKKDISDQSYLKVIN